MKAASSCQHSALLSPRSGLIGPVDGVCDTVAHRLCDADVGHRDLLEQVWRSDNRGGMSQQFGLCFQLSRRTLAERVKVGTTTNGFYV